MLTGLKDKWKGTLVMIGQPAEEIGAGAKAMLDQGLFEKFPRPDYCLALHSFANLPAGKVGVCEGFALANVDFVDIKVRGRGGHGAFPHTTKDPVVVINCGVGHVFNQQLFSQKQIILQPVFVFYNFEPFLDENVSDRPF